jgi:hypothetical protein
MKELIIYLERKIELCTEMNMPLERWAFSDALKKARELQLLQTDVSKCTCDIPHNQTHFEGNNVVWTCLKCKKLS